MKKSFNILLFFIVSILLASCGPDKETQAFLDEASGVWYTEAHDAFLVVDGDMTMTTFSGILLADATEYEDFAFSDAQRMTFALNKEESGAAGWDYVAEAEQDGETVKRYFDLLPMGTTMKVSFNNKKDSVDYAFLGEADEFATIVAPLYKEENRPYAEIDHQVYRKLLEKSSELGLEPTGHVAGSFFFQNIDADTEGLGTAISKIKRMDATGEEEALWLETAEYWEELMTEAMANGSSYQLKIIHSTAVGDDLVLDINAKTGLSTDYLISKLQHN